MAADPWTFAVAVASAPVAVGVVHFLRWFAPIVLPSIFARPASVAAQVVASNEARIADLERRQSNAEEHRQRDLDRAEDRHRMLLDVLSDIRHDLRVARRRAEEEG
jgi:hypothetical protein